MNLTENQKQALQIEVAKIEGWTDIHLYYGTVEGGPLDYLVGTFPSGGDRVRIPNYPEDLNVVARVVSSLDEDDEYEYVVALIDICGGHRKAINATSAQRCIALLMALTPEKWLEIHNLKD